MEAITTLAEEHGLEVLEDACMAIGGRWGNRHPGTFGKVGAFSMHPLKTLNVKGDGGMVVTDDDDLHAWMLKYRNHGMVDRDHIEFWGVNYRCSRCRPSLRQPCCARLISALFGAARFNNSSTQGWTAWPQIGGSTTQSIEFRDDIPLHGVGRAPDQLLGHLVAEGVEAKVHYPVPLHPQ